jgi:high-affinity nickel permease
MIGYLVVVYAGLAHAFEADHLIAVNSLVSRRNQIKEAVMDGIYWGLGHTSTIFFVAILMIGFKVAVGENIFSYLEGVVGLMLVFLGVSRLLKSFKNTDHSHTYYHSHDGHQMHSHTYKHKHWYFVSTHSHPVLNNYRAAFSVGLVHGLAGSGALVVMVLAQMQTAVDGLLYILTFGLGSLLGMFLASGIFSIPFSKAMMNQGKMQVFFVVLSSVLCIGYGLKVIIEHWL